MPPSCAPAHLLFLNLLGLWVPEALGLVHIQEEIFEQHLGLLQVAAGLLLVLQSLALLTAQPVLGEGTPRLARPGPPSSLCAAAASPSPAHRRPARPRARHREAGSKRAEVQATLPAPTQGVAEPRRKAKLCPTACGEQTMKNQGDWPLVASWTPRYNTGPPMPPGPSLLPAPYLLQPLLGL